MKFRAILPIFFAFPLGFLVAAPSSWRVASPDGEQVVTVELGEGSLGYRINRPKAAGNSAVLTRSPLGLRTTAGDLTRNLRFVSATEPATVDERYEMVSGKQSHLRAQYNNWSLQVANESGLTLAVDFRVFDDGLAFRYRFDALPKSGVRLTGEATAFALPTDGEAWLQPYQPIGPVAPAYEEYFTNGSPIGKDAPGKEGWAFPALFKIAPGWVLLTEADLDGSCYGAMLAQEVRDRTYRIRLPEAQTAAGIGDVEPTLTAPWTGPWRLVINGPTLATIAESNLVHHVSRPPAPGRDFSWVRPGRSSWSWWSDHASPRHYASITPFIDLSSDWTWEYSLIDANWNQMTGGDIHELLAYARERHVGLFLWYNSGGPQNDIGEQPRDRLLDRKTRRAEFQRLREWGVAGIKVDFFQSDKPWIIQLYRDILEDAADYRLHVVFHGCTLPRGWQRTYPNLLSMEAVRGAEIYSCCSDYGPAAVWHNTVLPFTRNVVGSMDYTPVTFTNQKIPHETTFAHELALSVVFESAVQHFADAVSGYRTLPAFAREWLKRIPTTWDETRFVDGYPGKSVVLARRKGKTWYLGGINGTRESHACKLDLSFLGSGSVAVTMIADGPTPTELSHEKLQLAKDRSLNLTMPSAGGFVALLEPQ